MPGFEKEWRDVTVDHDAAYNRSDSISPVDVSAVMWRYFQWNDTATPTAGGDAFGQAVAVGDFDNDDVPDLAISVPGFTFDATADDGSVVVFKGVYGKDDTGYVEHLPWMRLDVGGEVWSVAAGNFDGLPGEELAIGYATPDDSGEVAVFSRTNRHGFLQQENVFNLQHWQDSTWPSTHVGAQFGYALAVGEIGSSRDGLLVGAPGAEAKNYDSSQHDSSNPLTQPSGWQASQFTGVVVLLEGDNQDVLVPTATVLDPFSDPYVKGSHDGARFGEAVAVDRSGTAILIGAPQDYRVVNVGVGMTIEYETESGGAWPEARAGSVYGFDGALAFRRRTWTTEVGSEFGAAVTMKSAEHRYYVGAPNAFLTPESDSIGAGKVYAYGSEMIPGSPTDTSDTPTDDLTRNDFPGCGRWPGDRFGQVLSVGKLEPDPPMGLAPELLAVGAPSRNLTCDSGWASAVAGSRLRLRRHDSHPRGGQRQLESPGRRQVRLLHRLHRGL